MKNLRDSYKYYTKIFTNLVDVKTYVKICSLYNKFLMEKVISGKKVTLPARMGTLAIIGKKQNISITESGRIKGLAPDWVKTKKLWDSNEEAKAAKKIIYHTNPHTDNRRYKFLWSKRKILVENKILYSLRVTRSNKRAVYTMIKDGKQYVTNS